MCALLSRSSMGESNHPFIVLKIIDELWRIDVIDSHDADGLEEEAVLPRGRDRTTVGAAEQLCREPGNVQPAHEAGEGRDQQGARAVLVEERGPAVRLRAYPPRQARDARSRGSR